MVSLAAFVAFSAALASKGLPREEALAVAERAMAERGVERSDYALSSTREEGNGEWLFLYTCADRRPDCGFLVVVNGKTGRVTFTSEVDRPRPAAIPDAIQEAAFGHEIPLRRGLVVCLWVQGASPSEELIAKLTKDDVVVVDDSECESDIGGSYHKATRRSAIFYKLGGFHRTDESHATVEFKSYRSGLDAEGVTLFLELRNGVWSVVDRRSNWIS